LRGVALSLGGEVHVTEWQMPALAMAIGYLLGSIPFGLVLTALTGGGDLRKIGSGNIGATNVLRTGRKGLAAATVILDGAKGAAAVCVGEQLLPGGGVLMGAVLAGVMAFIGHCYPIWLKFRGGKGVATMLGVSLALHWPIGLVFAAVWLGALALSRISSVGGISAAIGAPIAALALGQPGLFQPLAAMAAIVLWKHRPNIQRLLKGEEPRVGSSKQG
jgi:glycerol-3-phosphate acyltransferase PlsY